MDFNPINISQYDNKTIELPASGTWPKAYHLCDGKSLHAINTAMACERPLLVKGETGVGKSQLARAAAHLLNCELISKVINSQSSFEDLCYRYDAVKRLGEAQLMAIHHHASTELGQKQQARRELALENFITPGPLWRAFDYGGARAFHPNPKPQNLSGTVLLLDEIDKAPAEFANSLLEALGNRGFYMDLLDQEVTIKDDIPCKLVVITSNDERDLPPAFVRRCVVLQLSLPSLSNPQAFKDFVSERASHHAKVDDAIVAQLADWLYQDRRASMQQGLPLPGLAEFIDALKTVEGHARATNKGGNLGQLKEDLIRQLKHNLTKDSDSDLSNLNEALKALNAAEQEVQPVSQELLNYIRDLIFRKHLLEEDWLAEEG